MGIINYAFDKYYYRNHKYRVFFTQFYAYKVLCGFYNWFYVKTNAFVVKLSYRTPIKNSWPFDCHIVISSIFIHLYSVHNSRLLVNIASSICFCSLIRY